MTPEQYEAAVEDKKASVGTMSGVGSTSSQVAPRLGMRQNTTPTALGPLKPKQQAAGASASSGTAPTTFAKLDGLSAATGGVRASGTIGGPRPPWLDVMYGGMPKTADGPLGPLATGGDKGGPLLTPDKKPPTPSTPGATGSSNFKLDSLPAPNFSPASPRPGESAFEGAFPSAPSWSPKPLPGPVGPNLTIPDRPGAPDAGQAYRDQGARGLELTREFGTQNPDAPRPTALPFGGRLPSAVNTLLVGDHQATPDGLYVPKPNTVDQPAYRPPTAPAGTGSRNDSGESSDFYTRSDGSRVYRPLYARPGQAGGDVLTGEMAAAGRDAGAFLGNAVKGLYGATTGKPVQYDQGAAKYRQDVQKWEAERDAYYKSIGQPTAAEAVALRNSGAAVDRSTGTVLNDTRNGLSTPANQAGQHLLDAAAMYGTAKLPFVGGAKTSPVGAAARTSPAAATARAVGGTVDDAARAAVPPTAAAPVATSAARPLPVTPAAKAPDDLLRYLQDKNRTLPVPKRSPPPGMVRPVTRQNLPSMVPETPPAVAPAPTALPQFPAPRIPTPATTGPILPPRPVGTLDALRMFGRPKTSPVKPPSPVAAPAAPVSTPAAAAPVAPVAKTVATQADDAARAVAGTAEDAVKPPPGTATPADEIVDLVTAPGQAAGKAPAPAVNPFSTQQLFGTAVDPFMYPGLLAKGLGRIPQLPGFVQKGLDWTGRRILDPAGTVAGTLTGTADLRQMIQAPSRGAAMIAPLRNSGIRGMAQTMAGRDPAELTVSPHYDYLTGRARDLYNRPDGGTTPDGTKTTGGFGALYNDAIAKPIAEVATPLDRLAGRLYHEPDKLKALADAAEVPAQNVANKAQTLEAATALQAADYAATGVQKPLSFYEQQVQSTRPDLAPVKMRPADLARPTLSETVSDLGNRATGGAIGAPLPPPEELQARAKSDLTAKPPAAPVPPPQPAEQQVQQFNRQYLAAARSGDTAKADAMLAEYRQKTPEERQSVAAVTRLDARAFGMPEEQLNSLVDAGTPQGSTPLSRRAAEAANEYQTLQSLPPERQTPDHAVKLHAAQQRMAETERNYQGRLAQVYEEKVLPGRIQSVDRLAPLLDSARRKAESGQPLSPEEQRQLPAAAAEARQAMADVYSHALRKANLDFGVKSDPTAANKNLATTGEVLREIDRVEPVLGADGQPLTTVRLDDKGVPHEVPVTRPASGIGKAVHAGMVSDLTRAGVEDPKAKADDLFSQLEGLPKMLLLGGLGLGAVGLLSSAFGIGGAAMPIMAALGGGAALLGLAGGNPSTLMTGDFWSGLPGMLGKIPGAIGSALGLGGSNPSGEAAKNTEVNMSDAFSRQTGGVDLADIQRALQPDLLQRMGPQQAANIAASVRPDQRAQLREYMAQVRPELGAVVDQVVDYDRQSREMATRPQDQRTPVLSTGQSLTKYLADSGLRLDPATGLPDVNSIAPAALEKTVTNMPKPLKDEAARQMERYVDGMIASKTRAVPGFLRGAVPSAADLLGSPGAPRLPLSDDDKKKLEMARKVYGMLKSAAAKRAEVLYGGKADGMPNAAFPASRLRIGRRHEREHTRSTAAATEIAKDHLVEDPQYYAKLEQLEKASFSPDLTPDQMAAEGVYGRMRGLTGPRLAGADTAFADWYRGYHAGTRTPDDDRQMARRRAVLAWHAPQFKKNPTPRRAFTLLNWATDPGKLLAPESRTELKRTMLEYRKGQDAAWLKGRSATT